MIKALKATNGHYAHFDGDGLMALYGVKDEDVTTGAADAFRGAREMLERIDQLNGRLSRELPRPMRIGIGIHCGEAIVGAMGPPGSQVITAVGDTVNTCARLGNLTKDHDCTVIASRRVAEAAGAEVTDRKLHRSEIKGRAQSEQFYVLKTLTDLQTLIADRRIGNMVAPAA